MKVTEYVPSFIELDVPRFEGELKGGLGQLTGLPFMERWWAAPGFYQFVRTLNPALPEESYLLLAEFEGGKRYYVVARLEGTDVELATRALPRWKGPVK
jgi:hypothetical protein